MAQAAAEKLLRLERAMGGTATAGGAAGAAGSAAAGAAGGRLAGGLAGGLLTALTGPLGLVAAGAVAAGGALWLLYDALKDPPKIKNGDDSARGPKDLSSAQYLLSGKLGGPIPGRGGSLDPGNDTYKDLAESEKATNRFSQKSKQFQADNNKAESATAMIMQEQLTVQESLFKYRFEQATLAERTKTIDQEIAKYSKDALQGTAGARDEVIRWLEKRKTNEREIAREKRQSATEDLQASQNLQRSLQDQLKTIQQQIEAKRDANRSALERFGMKSEEEQKDIISTAGRLRAGDKTVTPEEASRVQGFSDELNSKVSQFALDRANRGGAQQLFGNSNDMQLRKLEGQEKQLDRLSQKVNLEVKQKTDFIVKLDSFSEADAKKIAKEIDSQYNIRLQELAKRVQEINDKQEKSIRQFANQRGTNIK